jgi:glucosamine 6-phosphate synthetase-like amidotransferase/phosphosugar isomerase protein
MCGIAGFCVNKREHLPNLSSIVDELLLQIEARGKDSTGMAYVKPNRKMYLHKDAMPASKYVGKHGTRQVNGSMLGILHTRFATQGKPSNRANNHPIWHGNVIGVHNGHINNDDTIFRELGVPRLGQVDSEAAFALLDNEDTIPALSTLQGGAALAWFDRREGGGTLHLARVSNSPLAVGMTKGGSLFFASTMKMLNDALFIAGVELDWGMEVAEGTYMKVRNGRIESFDSFTPAPPVYASKITALRPRARGTVDADMPSRWYGWDGTWLDDDTFVPYN